MPYSVTHKRPDGTDETTVYVGFLPYKPDSAHMLVAMFDGDADLYSMEPGIGTVQPMSELRRMYCDDYGRPPDAIIVYNCVNRADEKLLTGEG